MSSEIAEITRPGDGPLQLRLRTGEALLADTLMCATGRHPNTDCGLAEQGVVLAERDSVVVDEYSRTNVESIYAVGDCTDRVALTPVAISEGQAFADTVFGDRPTPVDHHLVASAVFSQPTAASIGMTEADARDSHTIDVYVSDFRPMRHTLSGSSERAFMKLIVDAETDHVLGAHMVGEHAAEIIQCVAISLKAGVTKTDFDRTMAIHPTSAEEFVLMRKKR